MRNWLLLNYRIAKGKALATENLVAMELDHRKGCHFIFARAAIYHFDETMRRDEQIGMVYVWGQTSCSMSPRDVIDYHAQLERIAQQKAWEHYGTAQEN